jgi:hypothetical protein
MLDINNFDGMSEEARHRELLRWEDGALSQIFVRAQALNSSDAKRHLRKGLMLRTMMMQRARVTVRDECLDRDQAFPARVATDMAIHLNSFYLNLAGSLDNVAWALAFEHRLRPDLDESDWDSRQFCGLFRDEFQEALDGKVDARLSILDRLDEWYDEVREFRDPAAHRIPLAIVPGTLEQGDREEYDRIQAEALELLRDGDVNAWIRKRQEGEGLLGFLPIMESPGQTDERLRIVPNQMAFDQTRALAIIQTAVRNWFSPA